MNITSQFFITYYTGSEDLDLMAMPASFAGNIGKTSDYNRFIEGISSIYAAQSGVNTTAAIAGEIPVFWTVRSVSRDSSGNDRYSYKGSPDSTLRELEPKQSYYIILRDISYVPLKLPTVGFPVIGFTDTGVLPYVQKDSILTKTLAEPNNNIYNFSPIINNLQAYETYKYQVYGVDSNWPITMVPSSGLIRPSTQQLKLDIRAAFCSSTGVCPSGSANVINYTQNPPTSNNGTVGLYGIFQIGVQPISYDGIETISDQFTLYCEDCLPRLKVSVAGSVTNISVLNSGTGYKSAPKVTIIPDSEDTSGQGATAKALFDENNKDFTIAVESIGKNYIFTPTVLIDGGGGRGATATAIVQQEKNKPAFAGGIYDVFFGIENIYKDYTYEIRSKKANYPVVISRPTGLLSSTSTHTTKASTKLIFCGSPIKCPSGTPGLLNYVVESGLFTDAYLPFVDLEIVLSSPITNISEITSDLLSVSCPSCIDDLSRFISSGPEITIEAETRPENLPMPMPQNPYPPNYPPNYPPTK